MALQRETWVLCFLCTKTLIAHAVAVNALLIAVLGYAGIVAATSLVVALLVALGKSRLWMPYIPNQVVVTEGALSAREVAFLESWDGELAGMGFRPVITYRVTNGPRPILARTWLDPTATIICTAQEMATSSRREARFLVLVSHGQGEAMVTTRNFPGVPVFVEMPMQRTLEAVEARTARALLAVHRAAVEEAALVPIPQKEAEILNEVIRGTRAFCEFQEAKGILRRDEERQRWVGTLRAHVRVVLGQLLPSPVDFELPRLIRAVVLGSLVPAGIILLTNRLGGAWSLLSLGAFFGSGIAASTFFLARAWPWALILGALPLLVTGWLGPVPALALFMGALWGNVLILRRRGLTASRPAGSSRLVVRIFMWLALIILFFSFYALFSRQGARHDRVDRRPMKKPLR